MRFSIATLTLIVGLTVFTSVCSKSESEDAKNMAVSNNNSESVENADAKKDDETGEFASPKNSVTDGNTESVIVTPKKEVLKRKGLEADDPKTEITIRYPQISGAANPTIQKKIEDTISYWKAFDTTLEESLEDTWLYDLDYKVEYNKNGIFDILLTMSGVAAYPSESTKRYVVDLKTGEQIKPADVFENTPALLKSVRKKIDAEVAATKKEEPDSAAMFGENAYSENIEDFSVSDKGITFHYDYGFPHVALALQPPGEFFYTFNEMKPYIKKDGAFGQFVK